MVRVRKVASVRFGGVEAQAESDIVVSVDARSAKVAMRAAVIRDDSWNPSEHRIAVGDEARTVGRLLQLDEHEMVDEGRPRRRHGARSAGDQR